MIDDILRASPPPEAYRAHPMTVAELDEHRDAARIWATIKAITDWAETEREVEMDAAKDKARDDAISDCERVLDDNIIRLLREYKDVIGERLVADIESLECAP